MDRKKQCESIVLSKSEKDLLEKVFSCPHTACDYSAVSSLVIMGLLSEDVCGQDEIGQEIGTGTYCTSDFYDIYLSYQRDKRFELLASSLWFPALVSIITTLTVNGLQAWLPMLLQWFSNFYG